MTNFKLRDYQQFAVECGTEFLLKSKRGDKRAFVAPTGTGKSYMELAIKANTGAWIVTPRVEIIRGLMEKLGHQSKANLTTDDMFALGIVTPQRLRNQLIAGNVPDVPSVIYDEAHHVKAETWQDLDLMLGSPPSLGLTATFFRTQAQQTQEMYALWGEPLEIITDKEATDCGYISFPNITMWPLVDDDEVEVAGGEFAIRSLTKACLSRVEALSERIAPLYVNESWSRPTLIAVPSSEVAYQLERALSDRHCPVRVITDETSQKERQGIFTEAMASMAAALHINVVTEGVDLPFRRLIDFAPTQSPGRWMQQLGRIRRPLRSGELPPEYYGTNRNLERHGYLLAGLLPLQKVREAAEGFPPSKKPSLRAIGYEGLGRFKAVPVRTVDGIHVHLYTLGLFNAESRTRTSFACIAHPLWEQPLWAGRNCYQVSEESWNYGKWHQCEPPEGLVGYSSVPDGEVTKPMKDWWDKSAERFGIDPTQKLNRKIFQILPVLVNTGNTLRVKVT